MQKEIACWNWPGMSLSELDLDWNRIGGSQSTFLQIAPSLANPIQGTNERVWESEGSLVPVKSIVTGERGRKGVVTPT